MATELNPGVDSDLLPLHVPDTTASCTKAVTQAAGERKEQLFDELRSHRSGILDNFL